MRSTRNYAYSLILICAVFSIAGLICIYSCGGGGENGEGSESPTANWLTFQNEEFGYLFKYPPEWEISSDPSGENLYAAELVEDLQASEHYTPPTLTIRLLMKPPNTSFEDFVNSIDDGWYVIYAENRTLTIDGKRVLLFNDLSNISPRLPPLAAFFELGDTVLLVLGEVEEDVFLAILEEFRFD